MLELRRELADFLKSRRGRLLPADVGLSPRHGPMRFRHHILRPEAQPALRIVVYLRET